MYELLDAATRARPDAVVVTSPARRTTYAEPEPRRRRHRDRPRRAREPPRRGPARGAGRRAGRARRLLADRRRGMCLPARGHRPGGRGDGGALRARGRRHRPDHPGLPRRHPRRA
ncbi:hypothetical protein G5V59_21985 [Nocardioides sp. W3-2-3]|uniref:hypothetical protein n=1 Tax=Nocardioides convexus TaxID=2712224 RepID=UPI0024182A13|nr:hypothetical protein [Nocardioides convexus]NHA01563.1 hypothetical protein [Nocardioides convexus]